MTPTLAAVVSIAVAVVAVSTAAAALVEVVVGSTAFVAGVSIDLH